MGKADGVLRANGGTMAAEGTSVLTMLDNPWEVGWG